MVRARSSIVGSLKPLKEKLFVFVYFSLYFFIQNTDGLTSHISVFPFPKLNIWISDVFINSGPLRLFNPEIARFFSLQWMLRVVYKLPLDRNVFIFNVFVLDRHIVNIFLWYYLWNVAANVLYCIIICFDDLFWNHLHSYKVAVVSHCSFSRHKRVSCLINIVNHFFLNWHILNSAGSFY